MRNVKKIMLVDDDYAAHTYHKIMMEQAGIDQSNFQVEEFYSVDAAIEFLRENLTNKFSEFPAVILVDLNMPRKTGWDFLEEFRALQVNRPMPKIYLVSNSENPADIKRGKNYEEVIGFKAKFLDENFFGELFQGHIPN